MKTRIGFDLLDFSVSAALLLLLVCARVVPPEDASVYALPVVACSTWLLARARSFAQIDTWAGDINREVLTLTGSTDVDHEFPEMPQVPAVKTGRRFSDHTATPRRENGQESLLRTLLNLRAYKNAQTVQPVPGAEAGDPVQPK